MATSTTNQTVEPVTVVEQLTAEHVGWEIRVAEDIPGVGRRIFVLGGVRSWQYQGQTTVELVDTTIDPFVGTERHYQPGTPCSLIRPVKEPRRRTRR